VTRSRTLCIDPDTSPMVVTIASVMTPRTTAYSAAVCPASHSNCSRIDDDNFPSSSVLAGGLQIPDHAAEGLVDRPGQKTKREDDPECDDGENDAILGHRLALLLAVARLRELEPLGERHV
jgi:hypothetical protein